MFVYRICFICVFNILKYLLWEYLNRNLNNFLIKFIMRNNKLVILLLIIGLLYFLLMIEKICVNVNFLSYKYIYLE